MNTYIIIVSGLPRSGTSMMMRMLQAGGVKITVDNIREADDDNPKGYYEDERVKKLKENNLWLEELNGKAVKIISLLLYDLSKRVNYKIIFMQRDMTEILASQKKMLERRNEPTDDVDDETMAKKLNDHLRKVKMWLDQQPNVECLYIEYRDIIQNPFKNAEKVKLFLNADLDTALMAKAVDQSLYRNKKVNNDE